MKAKSLLLTVLVPATGLAFLSLPAGAECWMTCPPGSTATPSATEKPATAEPAASTEELTPAKKPEATAKASPTPAPAKPKAAPAPAGATIEPAASPEEATPAKMPEATAKASPTAAPTKPTVPPTVQSTTSSPEPAPTQDAVAPPAPAPNAAFQPASGSVSGTSSCSNPRPGARHGDHARDTRIGEKRSVYPFASNVPSARAIDARIVPEEFAPIYESQTANNA